MLRILAKRMLALLLLLLTVAIGSFLLLQLAPGDYLSEISLNPQIAPATVERLRVQYGLDQPWYVQAGRWLWRLAHGDFGYSLAYHSPASTLVYERLAHTLGLGLAALTLALALALPLGVWATLPGWAWLDRLLTAGAAFLLAVPTLLLALLGMIVAARTGWFPLGGVQSYGAAEWSMAERGLDYLQHLFLPTSVLALRLWPGFFRQWRASLRESLAQDFVLTARAKGVSEARIIWRHVGANALNPLLTMVGNALGAVLSGAFIVEVVMSWPGLGSLALSSLLGRDVCVLMACLLWATLMLAFGNLLADGLLWLTNPRLRAMPRGEVTP